MGDTVKLDICAGVATVSLNRPTQLNALSVEMMQDLNRALAAVAAAQGVEVVVIRGNGGHFMAGGDIREFHAHETLEPHARLHAFRAMIEQWINPLVTQIRALHQPVIASVEGACAGFGLSLVLACDLALCADNAKFTTAYAHIGLSGDGGISWFLPRVVGVRRATELLLFGDRLDARQAHELGLVNRVVPLADLAAETAGLVARVQAGPRQAYAEIKQLLNHSATATLPAQLADEALAFARCGATADFIEGTGAFLDKRKPGFQGR